jgi:hypothetical protein
VTAVRPAYGVSAGAHAGGSGSDDTTGRRVQPNTVESGTRLADRYRLEEQLKAENGFTAWRAVDEKLSRSVGVYVLPSGHPRSGAVVEAAQAAAMLTDTRFCQVLDASQENDVTYVVKEWLRGTDLLSLLQNGPLRPSEAAAFTSQVAGALKTAHEAGLCHLRLDPQSVVRTETGQVKVVGLTVDAALYGTECDDAGAADARALGALLYACLTARWPDGELDGLAAAPYENGTICSPRQVRAGVPAALDELTMRALCERPPHGAEPLRSPAEVAAALAAVPRLREPKHDTTEPQAPIGPAALPPVRPPAAPMPARGGTSRTGKAVWALAAAVLLAGIGLLGYSVAKDALKGTDGKPTNHPSVTGAASGTTIKVASVTSFDPPPKGNGEENNRLVGKVIDGNPDTTWYSKSYNASSLPPYKPGIGLVLDLGSDHNVSGVTLDLKGSGTTFELRAAAAGTSSMPSSLDDYSLVKKQTGAGGKVTVAAPSSVKTRYLLVWLTKIPNASEGGGFRSEIAEISVKG